METRIELNNQDYKWLATNARRERFYKEICAVAEYDGIRIAKIKDVIVYTGLSAMEMQGYIDNNHLMVEVIGKNTYVFLTDYACDMIHRLRIYVERNGTDILFTERNKER